MPPTKHASRPNPRAKRRRMTAEVLSLFDEITTSGTSWAKPRAIDVLLRDILLHRLGLEDRGRARRVLCIALEGAKDSAIAESVASLRRDRGTMLESIVEEYECELEEWRASQPKHPLPAVPEALTRQRAA